MHDAVLNKISTIKRCLVRINEEFAGEEEFKKNFTKQDSVILNLQRACEAAIDIANFTIKQRALGIPQSARDSFDLIAQAGLISEACAKSLKAMVGLRNVAVHNYQTLNLDIVISVVKNHLVDFDSFCAEILSKTEK